MRVPSASLAALSVVAEFMNVARSGLTAALWEQWCRSKKSGGRDGWCWNRPEWLSLHAPGQPLKVSLEEARAMREELHQAMSLMQTYRDDLCMEIAEDLKQLQVPQDFPDSEIAETAKDLKRMRLDHRGPFDLILAKLMELPPIRVSWISKRVEEGGILFKRNGEEERWLVRPYFETEDNRARLYHILGEAIQHGSIFAIKCCLNSACGTYFVTEDPRKHCCGSLCRYAFNNRKKMLQKRRTQYRHEKLYRGTLKEVGELWDKGLSEAEIKEMLRERARLPEQIMERALNEIRTVRTPENM